MLIFNIGYISLLLLLLLPIGKLIVGYMVYKNAKESNMPSPALWGVVCFFLPLIIGLPLYFIVNASTKAQAQQQTSYKESCKYCGKLIKSDYSICPYCGKSQNTVCPKCNSPVKDDWNNCVNCGEPLKKQ